MKVSNPMMKRTSAALVAVALAGIAGAPATADTDPPIVPSAPTGVQALPDHSKPGTVTVGWNNSYSSGGASITDYVVRAEPEDYGQITECVTQPGMDTSSCTFTGLQTNRSYRFTVYARNVVGPSVSAETRAFLWPAPEIRSVKPITVRVSQWSWRPAVRVRWSGPTLSAQAPMDEVAFYRVRTVNGRHQCVGRQHERGSCVVRWLKNGKRYRFVVERLYTNSEPMASAPSKPVVATKQRKR